MSFYTIVGLKISWHYIYFRPYFFSCLFCINFLFAAISPWSGMWNFQKTSISNICCPLKKSNDRPCRPFNLLLWKWRNVVWGSVTYSTPSAFLWIFYWARLTLVHFVCLYDLMSTSKSTIFSHAMKFPGLNCTKQWVDIKPPERLKLGTAWYYVKHSLPLSPCPHSTLCLLGKFSCFFCSLLFFFQNKLFQRKFQQYEQSVKPFGSHLIWVQTVC